MMIRDGGGSLPEGYDHYTQRETMAVIGSLSPNELKRLVARWQSYHKRLSEIDEQVTRKLNDLTGDGGWTGPGSEVFTRTIKRDVNSSAKALGDYSQNVGDKMQPMVRASEQAQQTALTNDIPWDVETQWDVRQKEVDQTLLGKVDEVFTGTDEDKVKRQRKEPYRVFDGHQNERRELGADYWRGLVEATPRMQNRPAIYERTETPVEPKTHQFDQLMEKINMNAGAKSRVDGDARASNVELKNFEPELMPDLGLKSGTGDLILPDDHRSSPAPASESANPQQAGGPQQPANPHDPNTSGPNGPGSNPSNPHDPSGPGNRHHPSPHDPGQNDPTRPGRPDDSNPRTPGTIAPGGSDGSETPGGLNAPRDPGKITPGTVSAGIDAPSVGAGAPALNSNLTGPGSLTPGSVQSGSGGLGAPTVGLGGPGGAKMPGTISNGGPSGRGGSPMGTGSSPLGRGSGASFNIGPGGKGMVNPGSVGGLGVNGPAGGAGAGAGGGGPMGGPMGAGNRKGKERDTKNQYTSWLEEDEATWNDPGHRNRTHTGNL